MKKNILGIAMCCAMMMLTACENQIADNKENDNKETLQEVTFSVLDFEQTLMQMGAVSADTRAALTGNATYLKVALFLDNTKKYEFAQTSEDDGFGAITALVVPENYDMVVIASKAEMTIEALTNIYPTGGKLNDTFYYYGSLTKANLEAGTVAVGLDRAVALFEFQTDAKPLEVTTFVLELTGANTVFNAVTGLSAGSTTLTNSFDQTGRTTVHCGMYVFLPSADAVVTVKATAYDADEKVVKTYTFNDVQMKPQYKTYCSGNFFQVNGSWNITLNSVLWPDPINFPYDLSSL
jgi:hypothetical protein